MQDYLLLHFIQGLLIMAIIVISTFLIHQIKKHHINPFKRFWTGFGIGLTTDLLDTLRYWFICHNNHLTKSYQTYQR